MPKRALKQPISAYLGMLAERKSDRGVLLAQGFLSGLPSAVSGNESAMITCLGDCTEPLRSLTAD